MLVSTDERDREAARAARLAGFLHVPFQPAEVLRALDALQATYQTPIATPANWVHGQDVIVALSLDDAAAKEKFGEIEARLPYLRTTKMPA